MNEVKKELKEIFKLNGIKSFSTHLDMILNPEKYLNDYFAMSLNKICFILNESYDYARNVKKGQGKGIARVRKYFCVCMRREKAGNHYKYTNEEIQKFVGYKNHSSAIFARNSIEHNEYELKLFNAFYVEYKYI